MKIKEKGLSGKGAAIRKENMVNKKGGFNAFRLGAETDGKVPLSFLIFDQGNADTGCTGRNQSTTERNLSGLYGLQTPHYTGCGEWGGQSERGRDSVCVWDNVEIRC